MEFDRTGDGMPCFGDEPERKQRGLMSVIRVGALNRYDVVACQAEGLVFKTHYYRQRTVPCPGKACPACGKGRPRWYAFLACKSMVGNTAASVAVLELPIAAMDDLVQACKFYAAANSVSTPLRGVLGAHFTVERRGQSRKGKLGIEVMEVGKKTRCVPLEEVGDAVCRLWGVPGPSQCLDSAEWRASINRTIRGDEHYRRGSVADESAGAQRP